MPLPQAIARFNKRYTNRMIEPLVARLPGFVVVTHTGRRSGALHRTPLYSFAGDQFLFVALTYGPEADWAQNVLLTGGSIETQRATHAIASCEVVARAVAAPHLPLPVRVGLRLLRISHMMRIAVS